MLGFPLTFSDPLAGWAQFELGAADIALERCSPEDNESESLVGRFVGVSIEVDDVNDTFRELSAKGVEFAGEPAVQPWGGTMAHLKDLDGNLLTLVSMNTDAG